jgi:hypothetical protein
MPPDIVETAVIAIDAELAATLAALGGSRRRRGVIASISPAPTVPGRQAEATAAQVVAVVPRDRSGETTVVDLADSRALDAAVAHATELWRRRGGRPE